MKMKKLLAIILALAVMLSVLLGIPVNAATGTVVSNTGVRHTVCTSLSSQAIKYYNTNDALYDDISLLQGGSDNCLTTVDSALFDELHNLMSTTMTNTSFSYNSSSTGLQTNWPKTDANNGSSTHVYFYSDTVSSANLSREHVWPKSHASFHEKTGSGGADPHHLRPEDSTINSNRSSYTMGNVSSPSKTYSYNGKTVLYYANSTIEVNDNIKGDVARILLYVYCRWEEPNLFMNDPSPVVGSGDEKNDGLKVIESLDTLLEWCEMDPVDTWEMSRNDQCENWVGNRNVFIDYPEYAWLLFGKDVPSDMTTPSGEANNGNSGSGSTTCTHSSTFTYTSTGASYHNVICVLCSKTISTEAHTISNNACTKCDYTQQSDEVVGTGFTLVTNANQLVAGKKVVIVAANTDVAMSTTQNNNNRGQATITKSGNTVTINDNVQVLTLETGTTNGTFAFNTGSGYLYAASSSANYLRTETTLSANSSWSVDVTTAGVATITAQGNYARNWMRYNSSSSIFACYASTSSQKDICLYIESSGTDSEGGSDSEDTPHTHSYTAVVTAPTCTAEGYTTYTCSCGDSYTDNKVAATGHSFTNNVCTKCGYENADTPETPSNTAYYLSGEYNGTKYYFDGTASGEIGGTTDDINSAAKLYIEENGDYTHIYLLDGSTKKYITIGTGSKSFSLSTNPCNLTYIADENTYGYTDDDKTRAPAFYDYGGTLQIRTYLTTGSYSFLSLEPAETECAHTYDNACDADCNLCGEVREVAGHNYTSVTTDATCTEAGKTVYTCTVCGDSYEEVIDAKGHTEVIDAAVDATCTTTGLTEGKHCSVCGTVIVAQQEVPALGHSYGEWIVDVAATTNKAGSKHRECSECGAKETEVIPMVFGFRGASLELQSSLGIIYTINADLVKVYGYTNIYATFEINGVTTTVTEYEFDSEKNIYRFKFRGLAPHVMNDNVVATLYGEKDGEAVTGVQPTYSVVGYCQNQLKKASNTATFKKFLVDTLKYGSKAQVYANHNASVLAIDQIDEAYKALGTSELVSVVDNLNQEYKVIENATTVFRGASLYLQDSIAVRYTFRVEEGVSIDDVTLKVSVPAVGDWTITSENFVEKSDSVGTYYQVDFTGLNPDHMKEIIYTTLYVDGVEASNTITYSIESYVARYSGSNTALREMIQAMMQYGESAIEYVAEQGK